MRRITTLLTELLLIASAILVADIWQSKANIIPRSLIHLPQVDYSRSDFWLILKIFLGLHLFAFLLMQTRAGVLIFSDTRRVVSEIFVVIAIYSISALTVFLATTVNFDPDLMAGIGLCSVGFFLTAHICTALLSGITTKKLINDIPRQLLKRLFSFSGVLILALALTPPILAYAFTTSRDAANVITQIRINIHEVFNPIRGYSLISATGEYRFSQPMLAKNPPNDPTKLYILERAGKILATSYPYQPSSPPVVVLDLNDKLGYVEVENGALGFAFHPEFGDKNSKSAGFVYLYYTDVRDNKQTNRISRFDFSAGIPADIAQSETPLLVLNRESSGFHNGGSLEFGPDGFLYIALGEGIHLKETSQAMTLRQGILRIDVDMKGGNESHPVISNPINGSAQNYFTPNNNPFIGRTDIREEYWAIGLRNPFRMSFDVKTGDLWAGDVGSTKWEEVNLIEKGSNYQFPYIEGFEATHAKRPKVIIGEEKAPVYTYLHTAYDRAVIGGIVYRGDQFPELEGDYIFADNYSSKVFAIAGDGMPVSEAREIARAAQYAQRGVSSVSQLINGDVLITTLGSANEASGEVLILSSSKAKGYIVAQQGKQKEVKVIKPEQAGELFVSNCGRCHGTGGKSDGPDSHILGINIPDFSTSEFQTTRTDEHLHLIISKGGKEAGLSPLMPPWEMVMAPEEIDALVKHIRSLQQK